jgi:hypothetical protein
MAILTNKPASVSADSTTSLTLNKADLQAKLTALNAGAYWQDQSTWRGVAFLFENANKQKVTASFDASGSTANLNVSEFFVDGNIECKRIDVVGFANDYYTIYRNDFTSASEFDIEITNGYSSIIPSASTLALYRFDNDANDVYGNNLTVSGNLVYSAGKFNQAASGFSAVSGPTEAKVTRNASFFNVATGDFTIECWAKFLSTGQQYLLSIVKENVPGVIQPTREFSILYDGSTNRFYVRGASDVSITQQINVTGIQDNNFHHIAIQRNSGTLRVFIDGILKDSASYTNNIQVSGYILGVGYGGWSTVAAPWRGVFDDLRFSNAAVYNITGFTPPTSSLT